MKRLVIIPAFDEGESLPSLVQEIRRKVPEWDLVVIDDGSVDSTSTFDAPGVAVVHLPFNLGIGGAIQTGFRYAAEHGYELAVQVDGDGQHPPDAIPVLLETLQAAGADMVIGSRFISPGMYRQTPTRALGIVLIRSLLRVLTGSRYSDCTSGFRLVNRRLILAFAHWYPDDYPEPEVLMHLHRAGCRVEEVAVAMRPRRSGKSSISLGKGLMYVAKVGLALILGAVRHPWPWEPSGRSKSGPATSLPGSGG